MKRKLKCWIVELRAPFLTATLVSIFLGTAIAWARNNMFNSEYFLLTLLGGVFLHLGTNVANDYYDHKSGDDEVNKEFVRPFSGGSRMIQLGLLTPREVLFGALLLYALASLIGLFLIWTRGLFVLVLGLIGLFSGFFYTGPLLNWASRGIGEALVGINFGALMTLGAYYVQTQRLAVEPLVASIPISLLIASVLYINEFPDYYADKNVGKNTLVVRLGREKAALIYLLMMLSAYVIISLNVLSGITPIQTLLALTTLPLAIKAVQHTRKFHSDAFYLVPSNALTTTCHFSTSLMLSLGYLLNGLEAMSLGYILIASITGICIASTFFVYLKIAKRQRLFERQKASSNKREALYEL